MLAAHIHAQVHLFEVSMTRNDKTADACIEESESNNAQKGVPVAEIQPSAGWDMRLQQNGINPEVDHREVAPFSCKE